MICALCKEDRIPRAADGWVEKIGYARPKSQRRSGTGDSLVERRPTGRLVCGKCIVEMQTDANKAQEGLFAPLD